LVANRQSEEFGSLKYKTLPSALNRFVLKQILTITKNLQNMRRDFKKLTVAVLKLKRPTPDKDLQNSV
jgi:hypothetical protein